MRHIAPVAYQPPADRTGEVEVARISAMRARAGAETFVGVQRPEFHFLLASTVGLGAHMLDFTDHALPAGALLWVRPGQVQHWGDVEAYDGWAVIFPAGLLDPQTTRLTEADSPGGPCWWSPEDARSAEAIDVIEMLARTGATESRDLRAPALNHLLAALLLRLVSQARTRPDAPTGSEAWLAFRELLEAEHAHHHHVGWYAERLGWTTRTLARATRQATGRSPKDLIDERVLLEARRLLAHTDLGVARVAAATGFDDASNFSAWFRLRAGQTPGAFRHSAAGTAIR